MARGSGKVQPLAMREVNLASVNVWRFGEQKTGWARMDDPCSALEMMGGAALHTKAFSFPQRLCWNAGRLIVILGLFSS